MLKVAYLFGGGPIRVVGEVTRVVYTFSPWADVNEKDWPDFMKRVRHVGGCCGKPRRTDRAFGTEDEVRAGLVTTFWR